MTSLNNLEREHYIHKLREARAIVQEATHHDKEVQTWYDPLVVAVFEKIASPLYFLRTGEKVQALQKDIEKHIDKSRGEVQFIDTASMKQYYDTAKKHIDAKPKIFATKDNVPEPVREYVKSYVAQLKFVQWKGEVVIQTTKNIGPDLFKQRTKWLFDNGWFYWYDVEGFYGWKPRKPPKPKGVKK